MARRRKIRELLGILKDKALLIKAIVSTTKSTASIHAAVLRATNHLMSDPPSEHHIAAFLSIGGHTSRLTSCTCIQAIMDRLHNSSNAYVALKCLIALHNVITKGSFILKDQLSFYPSSGGHNFLNLSTFRDKTDEETWELSSWVRWYAGVIEQNLIASRTLGYYFSSNVNKNSDEQLSSSLNSDLLRELGALVVMVEEISRTPESYHCRKNNLVYEMIRLVGEDYGSSQQQIMIRLSEFNDRMGELTTDEVAESVGYLDRLQDCRKLLGTLLANRKRNDEFWEIIAETKMKLEGFKEERERMRLLVVRAGSTRFMGRVWEQSQMLKMVPHGNNWLSVDWVHRSVSTAVK